MNKNIIKQNIKWIMLYDNIILLYTVTRSTIFIYILDWQLSNCG